MAWPNRTTDPNWAEMMATATVRQRDLLGFPRPGDEYWCEQTLNDVSARYRGMDMSPYR